MSICKFFYHPVLFNNLARFWNKGLLSILEFHFVSYHLYIPNDLVSNIPQSFRRLLYYLKERIGGRR